jgi:carbohydrate-selective porin OprB
VFYSIAIENHFALKADVQYINHPSGDSTIDDAWVLTLRATTQY